MSEEATGTTELIQGRMPGDVILRRRRHRLERLRRALTVPALFSTGYGNVGSSIYYALGVTALYALGAAPLALLAAGIFFIFTVLTYAEATVAVPEAGGASSFARHGLGEVMSFLAGWATMLSYTVTISISAFAVSGYLSVFFKELGQFPVNVIFTLGVIAVLTVLNIIGVREATTVSVAFAALDLVTQVLLVLVGGFALLNLPRLISQIQFGIAPTWGNFVYSISIAMVAYTGIETISNMVEEARHPEETVPRSYALLVAAVLILFSGISVIGLSAMPVHCDPAEATVSADPLRCADNTYTTELGTTYIADPVAGIAKALPEPLNHVFEPIVAVLASTILLIAANAGIMGVSRLTFSMGTYQQLPAFLSRIHRRFRTPYVSVLFFCAVAAIIVLPGNLGDIADVYIFAAMLTFTMAHLSVIAMRIRAPHLERPFRLPLSIGFRGHEIPLTAIVGGLGTLSVWLIIVFSRPFGRWAGLAWMIMGVVLFVMYRRQTGIPLNRTARRPTTRTAVGAPAGTSEAGRQIRTR